MEKKIMGYKLDLGAWNGVFAVPCCIVDEHLKLAGAAQLKVMLWLLRHSGEELSDEIIASALNMSPADVRDSMLYWKETGVVCENDCIITPPEDDRTVSAPLPAQVAQAVQPAQQIQPPQPLTVPAPEKQEQPAKTGNKLSRVLSRPEKPDTVYLAERMNNDESIMFLMHTADEIFGRPTSNNEKETLLLIHEYDGIPVEVLIMLLQYARDIGKCNIRYIEKLAINWSDEEINTLERAEEKIRMLTSGISAAGRIQQIVGQDRHSPTQKEIAYADKWLNSMKLTEEMIRYAYEICVDAKGKYIPKYVDSVLSRWESAGIKTLEQAQEDQLRGKPAPKKQKTVTYDIDQYESTNAIFEEGF